MHRKTTYDKAIARWLLTGCFLVAMMVIVGGITRLTHSGLSIVEWKPVTGTLPPLSEDAWMEEFAKYQQSPEFQKVNTDFTLEDYKGIYWWEYIHRLLARIIGLVFIIPFGFFLYKRAFSPPLMRKMWFVLFLGALQGFIGWIMVASGLDHMPRVSHYRLALHFGTALFLFGYILHTALGILRPEAGVKTGGQRKIAIAFLIALSVQIIFGAFTAGLRAGKFHNTWPKMDGEWISYAVGLSVEQDGMMAWIDAPAPVQFLHRTFAILVLIFGIWVWYNARRRNDSLGTRRAVTHIALLLAMQVVLGIFTLIYAVPVALGVLHQLMAIFLVAAAVEYVYETRRSPV